MKSKMPLTVEEFREKYQDKILKENMNDTEMIFEFFDMLQESSASDRKAIRSQFERLFNHMLKYVYQPELQSSSWIKTMINASDELRDWSYDARSIWRATNDDNLDIFYNNAREKTLRDCNKSKRDELDLKLPIDRLNYMTKENSINYNFIVNFCKQYVNTNLVEMVNYVNNL